MISVAQAIEAILARAHPLPSRPTPLIDALGLILDEPIAADMDLPPFDKALMDGYAVRSIDLTTAVESRLRVVEEISAGRMPTRPLLQYEATRIMTGAPLPSGADAVVMIERSRSDGADVFLSGPVAPGLNWLPRAREMRAGELLLERGTRINAAKLGLIASAGRDSIQAIPRPTIAIVPTGDELVPIPQIPKLGQIRNSNGIMLAGLAREWGATEVLERPIATDDRAMLRAALEHAIDGSDVLLVSGGVSAGTKDLVPSTLLDLGVELVFHKVSVKPGKPIWFGVGPNRVGRPRALVFGLPGNPVSGVIGFVLFVRPALDALAGLGRNRTQLSSFPLSAPYTHRGDRPTYHPSQLRDGQVIPLNWAGSADLRTVASADGFAVFPSGERGYSDGDVIPFLPLG